MTTETTIAPDRITLKLRKPITVHGKDRPEQLTELTLKLPSGRTVLQYGEPFTTKLEHDGSGVSKVEFKVNPALAAIYLADMTGYNADLLGQLHPRDVLDAFDAIRDLLRPFGD